jgi:hypothetical protein
MTDNPEDRYRYLDMIALVSGTDKSSHFHNYTKVYSDYFDAIKEQPIKFLEIGILSVGSVRMWEAYFPAAELHFIDIDPSLIQYHSTRSHYHFLDQGNPHALNQFIEAVGKDFDIIIDDGGHMANQQITSFLVLFSALKSGGVYVIEDLHTSYWSHYGGEGSLENPKSSPSSTIEFLKKLIDDLNYVGARTACASHERISPLILNDLSFFQEQILSMHFYDGLCLIIKR